AAPPRLAVRPGMPRRSRSERLPWSWPQARGCSWRRLPYRLLLTTQSIHQDSLHRAGRGGAQDLLPLRVVGGGIVHERFLADEFGSAWGQETALCVALTAVEIDHDVHDNGLLVCECVSRAREGL